MGKGEKKGKVCTNCGQGRRWIQKSDEEDKNLEKDRRLGRCEGMAASSWSPFFFSFRYRILSLGECAPMSCAQVVV